jgi:hypothetical protein
LRAACRKLSTTPAISLVSSARGVSYSAGFPSAVIVFSVAEIGTADGATGSTPPGWNEECETRPTCQSWRKINPPLAWTASTTPRQPLICCSE